MEIYCGQKSDLGSHAFYGYMYKICKSDKKHVVR